MENGKYVNVSFEVSRRTLSNLGTSLIFVLLVGPFLVNHFVHTSFKVVSDNPQFIGIQKGSFVVLRSTPEIDRGNLFTFKRKDETWISRIVALEGDVVSITDGAIFINNNKYIDGIHGAKSARFVVPRKNIFSFPDRLNGLEADRLHAGYYLIREKDVVNTITTVLPAPNQDVYMDALKLSSLLLIYLAAYSYIRRNRPYIQKILFHVTRIALGLLIVFLPLVVLSLFDKAVFLYYLTISWLDFLGLTVRESNYAVLFVTLFSSWLAILGFYKSEKA